MEEFNEIFLDEFSLDDFPIENFPFLNEILNPTHFEYALSEKLFLDLWEKYGSPSEIIKKEIINEFLSELVEKSKGYVILDQYSHINFDNIIKVTYDETYTSLHWKDFEEYRIKNLQKSITEEELFDWSIFGYATSTYMTFDIAKLKFVRNNDHLSVMIRANLIAPKLIKKSIIKPTNTLILLDANPNELFAQYNFWEGEPLNYKKHVCFVNSLPYYTCLIQPKQNCSTTEYSRQLLLKETINEIDTRFNAVREALNKIDETEQDEITSKGNTARKILEYTLKHFCICNRIEIEVGKYEYITLGDLKKAIDKSTYEIDIPQSVVNNANFLSHDNGKEIDIKYVHDFVICAEKIVSNVHKYLS